MPKAKCWILTMIALQLLWSCAVREAPSTLSREERQISESFRDDDAAMKYFKRLRLMVTTDEHVRRRFLLERCRHPAARGSERLENESYARLVRQAATELEARLSGEFEARRLLYDDTLVAMLYVYRRADAPSRRAWSDFLKTDEARQGRRLAIKLDQIDAFYEDVGLDVDTGTVRVRWLHWLAEYLRMAGLFDAFVKAADHHSPGLGERFSRLVSEPLPVPVSPDSHRRIEALSRAMSPALGPIVESLPQFLPPATAASAQRWLDQPMLKSLHEAQIGILALRRPAPVRALQQAAPNPDLEAFLKQARPSGDGAGALSDLIRETVKQAVEGKCESLR